MKDIEKGLLGMDVCAVGTKAPAHPGSAAVQDGCPVSLLGIPGLEGAVCAPQGMWDPEDGGTKVRKER